MSLPALLEYKPFLLPTSVGADWLSDIPRLELKLDQVIQKYAGEAILLPSQDLPAWYYLLLFKHLVPRVPEVVLQVQPDACVVLRTIYHTTEYMRPEQVHIFSSLFDPPSFSSSAEERRLTFDLASVPKAELSHLRTLILWIKERLRPVDVLIFQGVTDPFTALLCYIFWRPCVKQLIYSLDSVKIVL